MKIMTWNINSIRLRIDLLTKLVKENSPDVICLQETKVQDSQFPLDAVISFGFKHTVFRGEKGYNGVAILSKSPLEITEKLTIATEPHARHIAARLEDGTELHNFYVPAGGDEPDIQVNPKYQYKLNYVDGMRQWFLKNRNKKDSMILVGDLNIAPLEHDVWSHKQLLNVVSHTPPETSRMQELQNSLAWIDVPRTFVPDSNKLYSWWSYRNRDWKKSNRGRRLDHIWVTQPMHSRILHHDTLIHTRDWERPSDHVPVMVDFR